jgi:glycosyltransferase involved in cell wall biosynthesis
MPRFSIVIPTLRRADTLRHSLATVVAQTYEDFEVIVQNNGEDPESTWSATRSGIYTINPFLSVSVMTHAKQQIGRGSHADQRVLDEISAEIASGYPGIGIGSLNEGLVHQTMRVQRIVGDIWI